MTVLPRYRPLRLCSQGGGFEAIPDQPAHLDLARIRAKLGAEGLPVIDARVMLIVGSDPELTVSRSGRVLVKSADLTAAQRAWVRFWAMATEAAPPGSGHRSRTG